MSESVELSSLDLRYESHRLRDDGREARVLASMALRGIERPLEGVDPPQARFLLNGFKRCRCAKKLGIGSVPYVSLGPEEDRRRGEGYLVPERNVADGSSPNSWRYSALKRLRCQKPQRGTTSLIWSGPLVFWLRRSFRAPFNRRTRR